MIKNLTFPRFEYSILPKTKLWESTERRKELKSIAIFNQKGGVGKTTSTVNISACLEKEHKAKVLIVDCDSQCNATDYMLTYVEPKPELTIEDYLSGKAGLDELMVRISTTFRGHLKDTDIYLLPGTNNMDMLDIPDLEFFKTVTKKAEEDKFDYVFFDCPANLTAPTIAALTASDYVLTPARASDFNSLKGYGLIIDTVQRIQSTSNLGLKILGIFFNEASDTRGLDKYLTHDGNSMGDITFKQRIRSAAAVSDAIFFGRPLVYYKPTAPVTQDFIALTKEMIKKIKKGA